MNLIHYKEAEMHNAAGTVALWRVRGIDDTLYPTKIVAEIAARLCFPDEAPLTRYARLSFVNFYSEEHLKA